MITGFSMDIWDLACKITVNEPLAQKSFGLALEQALADLTTQTFLRLAVTPKEADHPLRVK
jgi:hypothetical protein